MKPFLSFVKAHKVIIGAIWGIVTTLLSLYLTIWPIEQNPKLTFYQKQKFDVLTIDKPIDELQVLLNGKDIRKDGYNLKVYKLKIINEGKRDIRDGDYAADVSFGINVHGGKIVRANMDDVKNSQLSPNLISKLSVDSGSIILNKSFIGKDDYGFIDIWILHKNDIDPFLSLMGKIADTQMRLSQEDETKNINWKGLLQLILTGGWIILALMLLGYLFEFLKVKTNLFFIKSKYGHRFDDSDKNQRVITKIYCALGKKRFLKILPALENTENMVSLYQEEIRNKEVVESYYHLSKASKVSAEIKDANYKSDFLFAIDIINHAGLAEIQDHSPTMNKEFQKELGILESLFGQPN